MEKQMRNLKEFGSSLSRAAKLTHPRRTNPRQELCKTRYLQWDLFGVQVKVLRFLIMKESNRKAVNRLQLETHPDTSAKGGAAEMSK